LPNYKRLSATHYIPKKILSATARRESVPESGRPVTRKTRVKTDDPMRATEGGETQAAAAAATSTTEATEEEEEEEEAATPLIIICSVPSHYYYTHHHHNRRARNFLVSQFRWLLPMRAKHGKQPNLKNNTNNQTLCRFRTTLHTNNNQRQKQNRNKGNNKQNKTKQTKSRACDLGFGVYPMRRRKSSSNSNDAAKVGIRKLRTHGPVFWSCVLVICLLVFEGRNERRVRNWSVDWGGEQC
jgi:hypothetical protein